MTKFNKESERCLEEFNQQKEVLKEYLVNLDTLTKHERKMIMLTVDTMAIHAVAAGNWAETIGEKMNLIDAVKQ